MKNFQWSNGFLALLVILSFVAVGFALGQQVFWLAGAFFLLGFAIMSVGLRRKRKLQQEHA
ncbi:DUF5325 family protein [Halobacillus sp. ACCC02827]|uniref:DUF5325 family protein n=1 Tax=Bacillaceae TaxID=186817 RepID=UPI0002A51D15|nr:MULTISPECIES: DUF5325 family protein [Bacillaceae]ELK45003.1 hypothetical protein D479_16589 [Halobacillus sp. BAB-2008]QHT46516.1 YlaF family protein [Bacillus sp. SB49]WJE17330.1 DUF5325 family protein [Halobacillus sp. ACCC02827]